MKVNRSWLFVSTVGMGCLLTGMLLHAKESGYRTPSAIGNYIRADTKSRLLLQPASRIGEVSQEFESAYMRSSDKTYAIVPASRRDRSNDDWKGVRLQLAAAIREQDVLAIEQLMNSPYGEDDSLDGLLIESIRLVGRVSRPENVDNARSRLVSFLELELNREGPEKYSVGRLIHLSEALSDLPGEESVSELFLILEDKSIPRAVRSTAALGLFKMKAPGLRVAIKDFRDELLSAIERNELPLDEVAFVRDNVAEMNQLLQQLGSR